MKKAIILSVAYLFTCTSEVQAQENRAYILQHTNVQELQRLAEKWSQEYAIKHAAAIRIAKERGWQIEGLQYLDETGWPLYYKRNNNNAAIMTHTTDLRSAFGVQGQGMQIGEWDGGHARVGHQDLTGRVTIGDPPYTLDEHATHVAGTLIGSPPSGVVVTSRGMAPQAQLQSWDWNGDQNEMPTAASMGMLVSNHSYGTVAGWDLDENVFCLGGKKRWTWWGAGSQYVSGGDDPRFGQYNSDANAMDNICWNAPYYLVVKSSGNDNADSPHAGPFCTDEVRNLIFDTQGNQTGFSAYVSYDPSIHPAGDDVQVSNISTWGNAKNILTVANLKADYTIHESSSHGRTDDGRIKPDICGKGTDLYSAVSSSNTAYDTKTGTSMASPNVAGSLLLLQQVFEETSGGNGEYMRSASLKGLAIHTATDLGTPGPDVTYGWGLLNADLAGDVIAGSFALNGGQTHRIIEFDGNPNAGGFGHVYTFNSDGSPLRVTLCYTDPPGMATSGHNVSTPRLVNDLDLRLVNNGTTELPYTLFYGSPGLPATSGDNDVDNVEQIRRGVPSPGTYQVYVNVQGNITGVQPYTLIISGQKDACNYSVSHGPVTLVSRTYDAQNDITSVGEVANGGTVTYNAGSSISLKPGFSAPAGSSFIAHIQTCN